MNIRGFIGSIFINSSVYKVIILYTLLFTVPSMAQQPAFRHLTINDGLSQNSVFAMLQSSRGFIWIGTEDGLNRYDGYEFKIFKNELNQPSSLSNNQVNAIIEDKFQNLIIGTAGGISIFDNKKQNFLNINSYPVLKELQSANFVTSLAEGINSDIWVGTYDGLKLFDSRKKVFLKPDIPGTVNEKNIQTLFKDHRDLLWISHKNGLKCLDLKSKRFIAVPAALEKMIAGRPVTIRVIREDKAGQLWFGTEQAGLFCYNRFKNTCINYTHHPGDPSGLPVNVVRDILFRKDGSVWIATRNGVSILDTAKHSFKTYTHEKYNPLSLSHRSVLKFMEDRSGSIWIGTFAGGINIYHPALFNFSNIGEQMGDLPGLNNSVVSSIIPSGNDRGLWIGTEGGGLNYIDRNKGTYQFFPLSKVTQKASENIIKALAKDQNGNLWIGAFDGLYTFDISLKKMQAVSLSTDRNYPGRNQVYALLSKGRGIWAGTNGGGLFYFEPGKPLKVFVNKQDDKNSISGNNVTSLLDAGDGNFWVGTLQGLNYFDRNTERFTRYQNDPGNPRSIASNNIVSLFKDSKMRLWIGTRGGGLSILNRQNGQFYAFTEKEGLLNNVIRAINEDKTGNIWVSSNTGLTRLTFSENNGRLKIQAVKNYTFKDGLQSNQFLSGSAAKTGDGEMLFGGISGITTFYPEKLKSNKLLPEVVFTDFLINNKKAEIGEKDAPLKQDINESKKITLSYDQAYFTIRFAALNFINSSKNSYAYKLRGFLNDDWHYAGNQRSATYTNLRAGDYEFMVKAANSDGLWSDHIAIIHITVLPPWYKTWWAYLLYCLFIGLLLYLFYYFSYKTARLKNQLDLEQMSHEKDQELAQRKFAFFTNISHEIKTPLTLILGPLEKLMNMQRFDYKVQNQLTLMQRNGDRLMRMINQLLDFRKFESGNMKLQVAEGDLVRFMKEIAAAFQAYAGQRNISLKVLSDTKKIPAYFDRDKIEKVMYNLISNSLKFTAEGGYIHIKLSSVRSPSDGSVLIEVEDNGTGISGDRLDLIFKQFEHYNTNGQNNNGTGLGLSFSKELIEQHHGTITVLSVPAEKGNRGLTVFTIKLPLGKDHFHKNDIIPDYNNSEDIKAYSVAEISSEYSDKKKQAIAGSTGDGLLMLIVEDNEEVLNFISSNFSDDFTVYTAKDGKEGMNKATAVLPDIIISDVMMPVMTGTELCMALKADQRTSHIPVILLTARAQLACRIEGIETGADDCITKPFNLRYLEARVWSLLDLRMKLRERYGKEITLQPANLAITHPDEKFLNKVMQFIENNIAEPTLTVEELSQVAGMSKATLYRKIKALTNQNTNEFIRTIRLNRAAQLLQQNKLNVNEIAYMVGFNNLDYFRKCFKEQFGVTPKNYPNDKEDSSSAIQDEQGFSV